jgi:hypothetical protein
MEGEFYELAIGTLPHSPAASASERAESQLYVPKPEIPVAAVQRKGG